jgi:hypothetical protein
MKNETINALLLLDNFSIGLIFTVLLTLVVIFSYISFLSLRRFYKFLKKIKIPKLFFYGFNRKGIKWQIGHWKWEFENFFVMILWFNVRKIYFNCKSCEGRGWLLPEPFRPGKRCTDCNHTGRKQKCPKKSQKS